MVQKVTALCRPHQILDKAVHAAHATAATPKLTLANNERLCPLDIVIARHHEICVKEQNNHVHSRTLLRQAAQTDLRAKLVLGDSQDAHYTFRRNSLNIQCRYCNSYV